MNFEYINGELAVFEDKTDCTEDKDIFTYFESTAGHSLVLGHKYELKESGLKGVYTIKKKGEKK